ncbi:hypothetical protein R6U77_18270 [Lysinibacillus louembei]|uniref:Autotransporter outer membrane beta-barrel domain-containing protein n=1 Tax=Lysinibacillus louembei TaxID=1470088 RepID=A0ABZ0RUB3_9BACI|nr:hypothetical protein [Lysinibacillus louembei]WPK11814.1 hypothetical protein R6U77_18270 [Lysinibacillus louembei]
MARIALDGAEMNESTASGHISIQRYQRTGDSGYPDYIPYYNWVGGYSADAKVNGKANARQTQVFINGKNAVLNGDRTEENDTYTLGSNERYSSGQHSNAAGTITNGNSSNVYIGGTLVSVENATVTTHANTSTTLKNNYSTNVNIGG